MADADEPRAFLDGQWLPQSQARLTLHDAGFVMGATVTDLCRTFQQRPYRLAEHLARFGRSCAAIHVTLAHSPKEIADLADELLAHNRRLLQAGQELALVLFATPGPIGYYLGQPGGAGDAPATFGMHTFPLPWARYRRLVTHGAALVVPHVRQVPGTCLDPHIKQRSRLHWWLAEREANRLEPGSLALLLDAAGQVTETGAANFFMVRRSVVLSPPQHTILDGVSLGVVRELCGELGIAFEERPLNLDDCLSADEAMLTGTSFCLAGVSRLQGTPLPFPGPIFVRLLRAWSAQVGVDIHGQITEGT